MNFIAKHFIFIFLFFGGGGGGERFQLYFIDCSG